MDLLGKRSKTRDTIFILLGTLLIATSVNGVYDPMGMVTGGVTGFAIGLKYLANELLSLNIPIWLTNLVVNIPLFIMAFLILGRKFTFRSLFAMLALNVFIFLVPSNPIFKEDYLLAAIFGGCLGGAGMGLVLSTVSTTGGTDLMAMLIRAKKKHLSVPKILLMVDSSIVIFGIFVFGINRAMYAIIAVYITAKISDGLLEGVKFAKMAYIISDKYQEIAQEILTVIDRGVTGIRATGMYSNEEKKMLFCVVSKKEIVEVTEAVNKIDPKAFVIVCDAREVMGEGFIEYKQ